MNDKLKAKYTSFSEPEKWKNSARHKNVTQYGRASNGNAGKAKQKKLIKPVGFSGKSIGKLQRDFRLPQKAK